MAASMLIKQIISKQPCIFKLKNCLSFCKMQRFRQMQILLNGTRFISCQKVLFSGKSLEATELKKRMENLTDKFAEAREMLGDAKVLFSGKSLEATELKKRMENLTDKFAEAREMLGDAKVLFSGKSLEATELKKRMENLTDKFAEAREMLGDARESQGTVYFSEDLEDAQIAVTETLTEYRELLDSLSDSQRQEVISTIGLRMEELKAQQAAIEEELKDH